MNAVAFIAVKMTAFHPYPELTLRLEKFIPLESRFQNKMSKQCQNCQQSNPPEAAFCLNCAAPLAQTPFGNQQANQQANQQWNQPNFGGQQAGQNFTQPQAASGGASQRAIIALVLTIIGLVFCCGPLAGIPAAIVGWMEMDAIKKGQSPPAGMWMAQVGLWGGIIVTILTTVGGILFLLLSAASSDPYYY